MTTIKTATFLNDFKRICSLITRGERVLITRPHNENLVVLSEKEHNELEEAPRGAEILAKPDKPPSELANGRIASFSENDLDTMSIVTEETRACASSAQKKEASSSHGRDVTIVAEKTTVRKQNKPWIDVRRLREKRQWLQSEAAEKLGISRSYLSAVEHGRRGISMNAMAAVMKVFGVKYEDFHKD